LLKLDRPQFGRAGVLACLVMLRTRPVIFAVCALLGASTAQAQTACEPKSSPLCRYVAYCMAPPKVKIVGPPITEDQCRCLWDQLARAFPIEQHAWVVDFLEADGPEAVRAKLKELFPDEAQSEAWGRKIFRTMFSKPACADGRG
jgi:hypothetical protein